MNRPDRDPVPAEEPAATAQEVPGPASRDSDPAIDDGSGSGPVPVPEPATDAATEHGRGAAQGGDTYRPL